VVSAVAFGAACGSHSPTPTPTPTPPPAEAPGISCPADIQVQAPGSAPIVVPYTPPSVSGGAQPVTTTCTIASGATFPLGASDVICTARDANSRAASCVFHVTVTSPTPKLRGTRFTAVGDSITAGEVAAPADMLPDLAYPHLLELMLQERYSGQTIKVATLGEYGRYADESYEDLRGLFARSVPDALLILSGVNDLNSGDPSKIDTVREALRSDIRAAKSAGVQIIFLSTLLPQTAGPRAYAPELIQPANAAIRALAASEGVVLVDNYAAVIGQATRYIGADGLHPSAAGHQKIAETFFESIKTNYEIPASQTAARVRR